MNSAGVTLVDFPTCRPVTGLRVPTAGKHPGAGGSLGISMTRRIGALAADSSAHRGAREPVR